MDLVGGKKINFDKSSLVTTKLQDKSVKQHNYISYDSWESDLLSYTYHTFVPEPTLPSAAL